MSIGAVNFKGEDQQQKSSVVPGAVVGTIAGAGTGYFIGTKQDAKHILKADKFEPSDKFKEGLKTEDEKKALEEVKTLKAANAPDKVKAEVEKKLKDIGFGEKDTDITSQKYADKFLGGKLPADAAKDAEAEAKLTADLAKTAKEAKAKYDPLKKTFDEAKKAFDAAEKGTDDAVKKSTKEALDKATTELAAVEGPHTAAAKAVEENATKLEHLNFLKDNAKEGKISKEALSKKFNADVVGEIEKKLTAALEKVKLPKLHPVGKIAIFAAIGLAAGALIAGAFSKKPAAPAEEQKA